MDTMAWADVVSSISLAIGLAACAGLRAWLPLLLVGGLARAGVMSLGPSFGFLASNRALILFGVATAIEIVGDKVPAVDHALDMLSTVLRPAAGSLIAASVMWQVRDPLTAGQDVGPRPTIQRVIARVADENIVAGSANQNVGMIIAG